MLLMRSLSEVLKTEECASFTGAHLKSVLVEKKKEAPHLPILGYVDACRRWEKKDCW